MYKTFIFIVSIYILLTLCNCQITSREEFLNKIDQYLLEDSSLEYNQIEQQIYRDALKRIKNRIIESSSISFQFDPPSYNQTVIDSFSSKTLLNPQQNLTFNPYELQNFNTTLNNSVCGVYYPDENDRSAYYLQNYTSAEEAEASGAFVTHLHNCGYCSTTKDLAMYMLHFDLTTPIRDCAIVSFVSDEISLDCIQHSAGLTYNCAVIWLYDALNTRKYCLDICLYDWVMHVPNNVPKNSTILNPCIQCDEDKSGPIFKLIAGRTRRDSGLLSAINRPPDSIYNITHYYY
ncbi:hypothetical protein RB653_001730 [Dictyostelium firmibasis]|uniref:Uncharacterized protein n=1 Tax=Dictyostelium firmibasis TaxID=79012 RepID=A0AAN7U4F8_9MYCE